MNKKQKKMLKRGLHCFVFFIFFIMIVASFFITFILNFLHIIVSHKVSLPAFIIITYTMMFFITSIAIACKLTERPYDRLNRRKKE